MAKVKPSPGDKPTYSSVILVVAATASVVVAVIGLLTYFGISRPTEKSAGETLAVGETWPFFRGCDGVTTVGTTTPVTLSVDEASAPPSALDLVSTTSGGPVISGHLYLFMSSTSSRTYNVVNFELEVSEIPPQPLTTLEPGSGGCGGDTMRVFLADLDRGTITDQGVVVEGDASEPPTTEPLGNTFAVGPDNIQTVRVDALACSASYDFYLVIDYVVEGESEVRKDRLGPYRIYGENPPDGSALFQTDPYGGDEWLVVPNLGQDYLCIQP